MMMPRTASILATLALIALPDLVRAAEGVAPRADAVPAPGGFELKVFPPDVHLSTLRDRQSLVVQVVEPDGITRDVTGEARFALKDPARARLDGPVLHPVADGETALEVEHGGKKVTVPVKVAAATSERPASFQLDVMPVFMKAGCNSGPCHGAARGKDGFRLSLFGFDPLGDHHRLVREQPGRRINLALPAESLLLEKAIGKVPHTGGKRFEEGSELHGTVLRWLEAGAPADPADLPKLLGIEVLPREAVLDGPGAAQRLTVRARYSDGTDRDVTSLTFFLSSNDSSAAVSPAGVVTAGARGESFVLGRFDVFSTVVPVITLPKGLRFEFPQVEERNYVDALLHKKLKKLRLAPSGTCSDEVFLRRATLDIVGLLPTPEEHRKFLARTEPNKRELLVDELLSRKEFIELWVMKWAELLQVRSSEQVAYKPMLLYHGWLQERLQKNVPMDVMVRELLSARGGTFTNAATNYFQAETDTLKVAENVAQVFLGMRIQCAQCHNHPFDRWTQDDYYGFAAFFSQIGRKGAEDPRETIVFNRAEGEVAHPVGGRVMKPRFLGGEAPETAGKDRREVMAEWLASPRNPWFAANLANLVWAHFFGRGIIHEPDDVRVSNPPVNAELLDALAKKFIEYRYDFKRLVRDICVSRAYSLSTRPNETNATDETNFSKAAVRRIRAEVLLDAVSQVTETKNKFPGLPLGARAVQMADGSASTYFLGAFGRASRRTVCSCEVKVDPNLSQALHLLNGDTVTRKIADGRLVERRLAEGKKPEEVVEELYLRCLSRAPTDAERARLAAALAAEPDGKKGLEDVFWALLNSREFLFNH